MIIGFCGNARSGKSEAAKVCEEMFGFKQFSFAEPIRNFMIDFLALSGLKELDEIKEIPHFLLGDKTPRVAMQTLGTEWGREMIDSNLWVRRCITMAQREKYAVISDVRFDNEAKAIIESGGFIFKIERPDGNIIKTANHSSEKGIDTGYISGTILNEGELYNYKQTIYRTIWNTLNATSN